MVFICFEQYKLSFLTTGIKNAKTKFESNNYLSSSELLKLQFKIGELESAQLGRNLRFQLSQGGVGKPVV